MISARFPTARNVYQERCRQTIWSGDFFRGGWYRTRTAAEATAACGGNREPRLGPRSDFSKPCQGAAENQQTQPVQAPAVRFRQGSQRIGMSTKKDAARPFGLGTFFRGGGTGREQERAKAGYHRGDGILPFVLICFISRSQHPLQYSLRENSP